MRFGLARAKSSLLFVARLFAVGWGGNVLPARADCCWWCRSGLMSSVVFCVSFGRGLELKSVRFLEDDGGGGGGSDFVVC